MLYKMRLLAVCLLCLLAIPLASAQADCSMQDGDAWKSQADNDYELDNYEAAIQGYTCMIETADESLLHHAYYWRGRAHEALEELGLAFEDIETAIPLNPNIASYYISYGNLQLGYFRYQDALDSYNQSLSLGYDSPYIVYYNIGLAYSGLDEVELALSNYNLSISMEPEKSSAYNNRGNIYYEQGDMDAAFEDYSTAINRNASRHIPYFNRGNIYYERGDFQNALSDYSASLDVNPEYALAFLARANAYLAIDSPNAYADYLRWIQLELVDVQDADSSSFAPQADLEIHEGTVWRIAFTGTSGQLLDAQAAVSGEDSQVDPLILLLSPAGSPIFGDDDSGSNFDAVIQDFPLPTDGQYTLLVTYSSGGSEGMLELFFDLDNSAQQALFTYQLARGEKAQVYALSNEGSGVLNLRQGPNLGFDVIQELPSGTIVTLINGPRKYDGFVWWQVETEDGISGWAVEHIGDVQTLQLALYAGRTAFVNTFRDGLNVRTEASTSADVLVQLSGGTLLTILEGPLSAEDFIWWKVRTADGLEGWAVERVAEVHTLIAQVGTDS